MKFFVAIIDQDKTYLNRITKYFYDNFNDRVELCAFSTTLSFFAFLKNESVDVILINENIDTEDFEHVNIPLIKLIESPQNVASDKKYISKYSSCDEVYKKMLGIASEFLSLYDDREEEKYETTVFISTYNYYNDFISSVAYAKNLSGKSLYIDMSSHALSQKLLEKISKYTMTDFAIDIKNSNIDYAMKLESYIYNYLNLDFLIGCENYCDLVSISFEDIEKLMNAISVLAKYENIIIFTDDFTNNKAQSYLCKASKIIYTFYGTKIDSFIIDRINKNFRYYENKYNNRLTDKINSFDLSEYNFYDDIEKSIEELSGENLWKIENK